MRLHRGAAPPPNSDSSSDDDDDAFSAMIRKKKKNPSNTTTRNMTTASSTVKISDDGNTSPAARANPDNPSSSADTSSNRRHHHVSSARAAKMDALLLELQKTATSSSKNDGGIPTNGASFYGPGGAGMKAHIADRPPPEKMGSYVMPGEELLTTNIFVGNLAPITTEEELTDVFRQFGAYLSTAFSSTISIRRIATFSYLGFSCCFKIENLQYIFRYITKGN
mmetsp:Transcript_7164/g.10270  ORF Transcript_7164/g.10270 Transcript_7164/m.10270 type:complete len:223 (+) Transcript_7164:45-713(+)